MEECVALARDTAQSVAERFDMPVYLYEEASINPRAKSLEDIRRGGFEGLAAKMRRRSGHPTTVRQRRIRLRARRSSARADAAHRLQHQPGHQSHRRGEEDGRGRAIQQRRVCRYVKAMGVALADRGIVQVSMNLTNYEKTPILRAFEAVTHEAQRLGVDVLESEIVGLVPAAALAELSRPAADLK